jgi:5-formyltetrahydrofolate cyclo-ligase
VREDLIPRGLIDLDGSCPCLSPWARVHGAHLLCRYPGSNPTAIVAPRFPQDSNFPKFALTDTSSKAALRNEALARRRRVTEVEGKAFAVHLAEAGGAFATDRRARIASVFWAIKDEVVTLQLLKGLAARGITTALPVMRGFGKPLEFRSWAPGEPLTEAKWGIMEPPAGPEIFPDLVFVPLAAFDRAGNRLGYGAGFYDRTLARLRAKQQIAAVGVGYAVQEFPTIPTEATDEKLDYVLTDREWIVCGS